MKVSDTLILLQIFSPIRLSGKCNNNFEQKN